MAWSMPRTNLPHDALSSSVLNSELYNNLAASELEVIDTALSLVGVAGAHSLQEMTYVENTSSTAFNTSSTTPVSIANPTVSVNHSGVFLVFWSANMSITASDLGNVGPQLSGGSVPASLNRTIRTSSSLSVSHMGAHLYYDIVESPKTVSLYGWVNNGVGTLSVGKRVLGAIAM